MRFLVFAAILLLLSVLNGAADEERDNLPMYNRIIKTLGSEEQFLTALKNVSDHASCLRNGIKNHLEGSFDGAYGLVKQVIFDDGIKWAAKISETRDYDITLDGFKSLAAVEEYCPYLSIARNHGKIESLANSTLIYHFSEWVEGHPLYKDSKWSLHTHHIVYDHNSSVKIMNMTLPAPTISQLAQFIYNLTTCPIPRKKSIIFMFMTNSTL